MGQFTYSRYFQKKICRHYSGVPFVFQTYLKLFFTFYNLNLFRCKVVEFVNKLIDFDFKGFYLGLFCRLLQIITGFLDRIYFINHTC